MTDKIGALAAFRAWLLSSQSRNELNAVHAGRFSGQPGTRTRRRAVLTPSDSESRVAMSSMGQNFLMHATPDGKRRRVTPPEFPWHHFMPEAFFHCSSPWMSAGGRLRQSMSSAGGVSDALLESSAATTEQQLPHLPELSLAQTR